MKRGVPTIAPAWVSGGWSSTPDDEQADEEGVKRPEELGLNRLEGPGVWRPGDDALPARAEGRAPTVCSESPAGVSADSAGAGPLVPRASTGAAASTGS